MRKYWFWFCGIFLVVGFVAGRFSVPSHQEADQVYAIWDGQKITGTDVLPQIQNDLEQMEKNIYQIKKTAVESWIRQKLSGDNPPPDPMKNWTEQDVSKEMDTYLKERNLNPKNMSRKDLDNISNNLKIHKARTLEKNFQNDLISRANIQWKIPLPAQKLSSLRKGWSQRQGPSGAPVTVIFVSNFHCPSCTAGEQRLGELKAKYKDQIQIYYRFAMTEPDTSIVRATAEAALCANDQNLFWHYHDVLTTNSPPTDSKHLFDFAAKVGLLNDKFQRCVEQRQFQKEVEKDIEETQADSILAPSFVIDGKVIASQESLENISLLIDSAL